MKSNPFTITFGIEPSAPIKRIKEAEKITSDFSADPITNYVYIITGPRGSGKTVLLSSVSNYLAKNDDWIVVDPGPKDQILENVASEIYETTTAKRLFLKGEFSFSFQGVSFSLKGKEPVTTVISLIKKMVGYLNKKGKRVLITIDEVDNSPEMKKFVQAYESLIRHGYKILLLMTGLYENVSRLQDDTTLTFLYRAPKIALEPLNLAAIASSYETHLGIGQDKAVTLAKFTNGYAYAYQVLGHLLYDKGEKELSKETISEFDQYMGDYVYDKVFSELSSNEQHLLLSFKTNEIVKVEDLRKRSGFNSKTMSVYRDRLLKKGILQSPKYGYLKFSFPRFFEYLLCKE